MKTIRITSFGLRGTVGDDLSPNMAADFTSAFATFLDGGRVLTGRDTRTSSPMIQAAAISALLSAGCEVLDLGVCPTPMMQFLVKQYQASGAIAVSGGHHAMGWNTVTLIGSDGAILEPIGSENVLDFFHAGDFLKQDWRKVGVVSTPQRFSDPYWDALEGFVNLEALRAARFTVLIDPVGGAGCDYLQVFADRLGLTLIPINAQPSGYLAREAEPRPRSAQQMAAIIKHLRGNVGFVLSSDLGRLSLVTERGEPISEEYTFAVIAQHVLRKNRGTLVTNVCTSRMIDDLAAASGVKLIKTAVGQAYVMAALADEPGVMAGEGSGCAALPNFSRCFDGFLMMAMILEAMAERGCDLSQLLETLPRYHIVKKGVPAGSVNAYRALQVAAEQLTREAGVKVDWTDGLRVDWADGWVHVRRSRTEQLLRVISEASSRPLAEQRALEITRLIEREV